MRSGIDTLTFLLGNASDGRTGDDHGGRPSGTTGPAGGGGRRRGAERAAGRDPAGGAAPLRPLPALLPGRRGGLPGRAAPGGPHDRPVRGPVAVLHLAVRGGGE